MLFNSELNSALVTVQKKTYTWVHTILNFMKSCDFFKTPFWSRSAPSFPALCLARRGPQLGALPAARRGAGAATSSYVRLECVENRRFCAWLSVTLGAQNVQVLIKTRRRGQAAENRASERKKASEETPAPAPESPRLSARIPKDLTALGDRLVRWQSSPLTHPPPAPA